MPGDALIRATIVIATLGYAYAEWLRYRQPARWRRARLVWTAAAMMAVAHAAAALHVRHGWSHRAALASTASQTAAVTGIDWGGGLYVNYAFLALWSADAAWWWRSPTSYRAQSPWLASTRSAIFLFMFLNGGVIFAHGAVRWLGAACVIAAGAAWYFRSTGSSND